MKAEINAGPPGRRNQPVGRERFDMSNDLSYFPRTAADHAQPAPPAQNRIGSTPNIADRFADLLAPLSTRRRRGLIARLSVGYYEGWRPSRAEVAELVAQELRRSPR
jgi:hypothetical protein